MGGVLVLSLRRDVNNGECCQSLQRWGKRFGRFLPDRSDIKSLKDLKFLSVDSADKAAEAGEPAYGAAKLLQSASGVFP